MCGIVGYVGRSRSAKWFVNVLKKLEYRGYDSAGLASLENGKFTLFKEVGHISELEKIVPEKQNITCAIAHTRWATHGKPTKENAHPHVSKNKEWAVVHNGIIENYLILKQKLKTKPESETDTAVLPQMLEESTAKNIHEFIDLFGLVHGGYAIASINSSNPQTMFLAKQKSPLYVSQNEFGDILVASDPICFSGFSSSYYSLDDGEFAEIKNLKITFFNAEHKQLEKTSHGLDEVFDNAEKGQYSHFMEKEIFEQSDALKRLVQTYKERGILNKFNNNFISKFSSVKLIGCGTAYHAGLIGARFLSKLTGLPASAETASEFIYNEPIFADEQTLFIFVSQSGETADTLQAVNIAKSKGVATIALTNVMYSTIAKKCDHVLPVCAGVEIAVASTKAYVCQLSALYLFATHLREEMFGEENKAYQEIENVAEKILKFDKLQIEKLAEKIKTKSETIYIGKDIDYVSASEASLKLKEVAYINSASYPSGELKHGFLALVEEGTPLVVLAGNKNINQKTMSSASEARSRGAYVVGVTNDTSMNFDETIFIDEPNEMLFTILSIVPLQYLAFKVSMGKNINPDQPRNLAKSVTVE